MANEISQKKIFAAWDRMNTIWLRYWTYYEEKGKTLSGTAREEHIKQFRREVHFLVRNHCDLEFHQYINKRLDYTKTNGRKDGLVIRKHIKELAKFVILDTLRQRSGKFGTARDALPPKPSGLSWADDVENSTLDDKSEEQSYSHLLRMVNEYYPELLSTRIELKSRMGKRKAADGRRVDDRRERIVETQFSRDEKLPQGIFDLVMVRALGADATPEFLERTHFQSRELIKATVCDPIDLAKLHLFHEDVISLIEKHGVNPFVDETEQEKQVLDSGLVKTLTQMLFLQLRTLEELRWFRSKSERMQNKIIFREPRFPRYSRKDAKRAVALSYEWFRDPVAVMQLMSVAGRAYVEYMKKPLHQVGGWLMEECLQQLELPDDFKALASYNVAMTFQVQGKPRLMLKWLKKSLEAWEHIPGHPGDMADIHGYMAEYWRNKDASKYSFHRETAERLAKSPELTTRRKAYHFKILADCAHIFSDREWEKRLYEQGLLISSKDPSSEDYSLFFSQCISDLETLGTRGPQGGPGRVPAPVEFGDYRTSSSFTSIYIDPDAGN